MDDVSTSTEPVTLSCGCLFTPGKPGKPGKFLPCGELHRGIALRYRKPGATWVIVAPLDEVKP